MVAVHRKEGTRSVVILQHSSSDVYTQFQLGGRMSTVQSVTTPELIEPDLGPVLRPPVMLVQPLFVFADDGRRRIVLRAAANLLAV